LAHNIAILTIKNGAKLNIGVQIMALDISESFLSDVEIGKKIRGTPFDVPSPTFNA
jgi:hypothetical protein